jgi:hypothetical protein
MPRPACTGRRPLLSCEPASLRIDFVATDRKG